MNEGMFIETSDQSCYGGVLQQLPDAEEEIVSAPFEQRSQRFIGGANDQAYNEKDGLGSILPRPRAHATSTSQ